MMAKYIPNPNFKKFNGNKSVITKNEGCLLKFMWLVKKGETIYKCKHYKILSLETLSLDVKYEFNSDNKRMYSGECGTIILDEGDI